jgi:tripartite-type tricarboxylate transporter receptor subunit TctC
MKTHFTRAAIAAAFTVVPLAAQAWEPTKTVEFVIPAGTGGGADQMARFIQGMVAKHGLMKQSMVVVNKAGGAGAEGFLDVKGAKGDPHKIIITLSNLFTTPLATGVPFNWKDLTPVKMMALDQFVLWVNAETPYKTAGEYVEAAKKAGPGKFKMAGTGSRQEDQIITAAIEQQTGIKLTYIPFKGGKLKPLCVFDPHRMPYKEKVTTTMSWADIPTCKEGGLDVSYLMLRGIFMPGGVTPDQVAYYVDLLNKIQALPEWKEFMEKGAFNTTSLEGKAYADWVAKEETRHVHLMKAAGFLAEKK